jgi:menaquinone-dependent protoporphyrinogen IX oxidase
MKTLIVYESQFGNTHHVAEVIGKALEARGPVRLVSIHEYRSPDLEGIDLFLVGGPTQAHTMTQAMRQFLGQLKSRPSAIVAAGFDTRIAAPKLLTGAAAKPITRGLKSAGFEVVVEGESFLVAGKDPSLAQGEEEHATTWASRLIAIVDERVGVAV